jgi:hypothetical protein
MTHKNGETQGDDKLEGRYANYFKVGYNSFEFVIDFEQCYHEHKKNRPHTRIITSPNYAKALLEILQKSIEKNEHRFGQITGDDEEKPYYSA